MTSSNESISRVNGPLCGEFTGPRCIPGHRPVTRSFVVFFDLRLNEKLSKQSRGWWLETPSRPLWRHSYVPIYGCVRSQLMRYNVTHERYILNIDNKRWFGSYHDPFDDNERIICSMEIKRAICTHQGISRMLVINQYMCCRGELFMSLLACLNTKIL